MTWKVIEYIMSNIQSWAGNKTVTQKYQLKAGDSQSEVVTVLRHIGADAILRIIRKILARSWGDVMSAGTGRRNIFSSHGTCAYCVSVRSNLNLLLLHVLSKVSSIS